MGELLKLGFTPTISRWLRDTRRTPDPAQRWLTFLRNHREAIAAMDFFIVPPIRTCHQVLMNHSGYTGVEGIP